MAVALKAGGLAAEIRRLRKRLTDPRALQDAALAAAEQHRQFLRKQLNKPGTGRIYPSARGVGYHQASAPGESPAPDRGDLRDSAYARKQGAGARSGVGPHESAVRLQRGSASDNMAPRPYIDVALDAARAKMAEAAAESLRKVLR